MLILPQTLNQIQTLTITYNIKIEKKYILKKVVPTFMANRIRKANVSRSPDIERFFLKDGDHEKQQTIEKMSKSEHTFCFLILFMGVNCYVRNVTLTTSKNLLHNLKW